MAVLPYGRPGVISGAMLGLGRALGETIAVLFILGKVTKFSPSLFNGGETFASKIAGSLDGFGQHPGPYLAAGLTLFVLTFIVNGRPERSSTGGRTSDDRGRHEAADITLRACFGQPPLQEQPCDGVRVRVLPDRARATRVGAVDRDQQRVELDAARVVVDRDAGEPAQHHPGGGALHAIVGTLEQVGLCTVISVPIGLLVAVYLVEYGAKGRLARTATFMVDILTGIPSIVAALFIYALMVQTFGQNQLYGFLVSLALVILMVPVIVRSSEEMLRLVPNELREASYALGVPKWKTITKVVIPTAFTGLITGVILGIARVAGETAPLLILVGYADGMNANPFNGFQGALPTMIRKEFLNFNTAASGQVQYHLDANGNRVAGAVANYAPDRLWGAALTLILLVLALTLIARFIGRFNKVAK